MLYHLIVIPKLGAHSVVSFRTIRTLAAALTQWLTRKQEGQFDGELLIFHGKVVEYSTPVISYRLNVPDIGELSISDTSKDKYTQLLPKISD